MFEAADEFSRFREFVVNTVFANDVSDTDLKEKREPGW